VTGDVIPAMEDLLQFLYLMPVGVVKFRSDGTIEMMNPVAAALLLSMTSAESLQDIYSALAPIAPDLRNPITEFAGPAGTIIDQQRLSTSVGSRTLVLSLTVNKIKDSSLIGRSFVRSSTTCEIMPSTRLRSTGLSKSGTSRYSAMQVGLLRMYRVAL
jgi:PAS domain-containing protein